MKQVYQKPLSVRTFLRPLSSQGNIKPTTEYFGCNVFNLKAMSKILAPQDLRTIAKVMKFGGKIDATLAERIAVAAKEWAVNQGATHYCHWFQPQTGATAEKHDAFLWFDDFGQPIERFTGKELLQSEPDASSFPSGGMRSTFEARGYTGWDASSPMFIIESENSKTLYVPSVFVSYHGESLDFKAPLLRSNAVLSQKATRLLHMLGHQQITEVTTNIGSEQEFFIVESAHVACRPDLKLAGRAVFGRMAAKGQELEDHYFGHIPSRVQAFLNELEVELYRLGVPIKTRHNEVAPGQFEVAPIFENSNLACDHNQLTMKMLRIVAMRHGFTVLLHEKPFAGVNGSGKHVNWSMADSEGRNLLEPGHTPQENIVFLAFLTATLQGIYEHADVLRSAIASAGNDHRLGANEAPPAIMSVFLGSNLNYVLDQLENGDSTHTSAANLLLKLGLDHVQDLAKDNTDRNRTSPFAFTGNKFEFRAVGSSASVSFPASILNSAVASGIQKLTNALEPYMKDGVVRSDQALEVIRQFVKVTKSIRFEGNGYSQEWKAEAARRGLSNYPHSPAAIAVLKDKSKYKFLVDLGILSESDIESRMIIQLERYVKQSLIEINAALEMARTGILPASLEYANRLYVTVRNAEKIEINCTAAKKLAGELNNAINAFDNKVEKLIAAAGRVTTEHLSPAHLLEVAFDVASELMPKMEELRKLADPLEALLPCELWPYPTYGEMLFRND